MCWPILIYLIETYFMGTQKNHLTYVQVTGKIHVIIVLCSINITIYIIEMPLKLLRTLFAHGNVSDPTLVDLIRNFFVLCTNMKVNLYHYS